MRKSQFLKNFNPPSKTLIFPCTWKKLIIPKFSISPPPRNFSIHLNKLNNTENNPNPSRKNLKHFRKHLHPSRNNLNASRKNLSLPEKFWPHCPSPKIASHHWNNLKLTLELNISPSRKKNATPCEIMNSTSPEKISPPPKKIQLSLKISQHPLNISRSPPKQFLNPS